MKNEKIRDIIIPRHSELYKLEPIPRELNRASDFPGLSTEEIWEKRFTAALINYMFDPDRPYNKISSGVAFGIISKKYDLEIRKLSRTKISEIMKKSMAFVRGRVAEIQ